MAVDPAIKVECAFGYSPFDSAPVWRDITAFVREVTTGRGRNMELDAFETGTVSVVLDNNDGLFTPRASVPAKVIKRTNYVPDPSSDTAWLPAYNGTINLCSWTVNGGKARSGNYAVAVTVQQNGVANMPFQSVNGQGYTAGPIAASVYTSMVSGTARASYWLRIRWVDSTGALVGYSANGPTVTPTSSTWQRATIAADPGALPNVAAGFVELCSSTLSAGANELTYWDDFLVETGTLVIGDYFDGGTGNLGDWWDGFPGSVSRQGVEYPAIRPRTPIRITATYGGTTYALARGAVERWPAVIDNADLTVNAPASDAFRALTSVTFDNSDTGQIEKFRPAIYFPMQEDGAPLIDSIKGLQGQPFWSGYQTPYANEVGNPLPVVTYNAASVLPSGAGNSVDLGTRWVSTQAGGPNGGWCFTTNTGTTRAVGSDFAASCSVTIPALPVPYSGAGTSAFGTFMQYGWATIGVREDGSVDAFGAIRTDPGIIQPNTNYRITATLTTENSVKVARLAVNGYYWEVVGPGYSGGTATDRFTIGSSYIKATDGSASDATGGKYAHAAVWDRGLSKTEVMAMWSDNLCAPGMTADTRMNTLLDYAGWPTAMRSIDKGLSKLNRESFSDNTSVLSLLQKWAADDGGTVHIDASGNVAFRNRQSRVNRPVGLTLDVASDTGPEGGIEFIMDEEDIRNVIVYDVKYGAKGRLRDETSIALYGEKPYNLSLDIQSSNEGFTAAQALLSRYSTPLTRVSTLTLLPSSVDSGNLWPIALGATIGTKVRLQNLPAAASASQVDFFIESVKHTVKRAGARLEWVTTLDVSPVVSDSAWVLEDASLGVLDSTALLTY